MVYGLWFMVYGLWFMVYGLGFRVQSCLGALPAASISRVFVAHVRAQMQNRAVRGRHQRVCGRGGDGARHMVLRVTCYDACYTHVMMCVTRTHVTRVQETLNDHEQALRDVGRLEHFEFVSVKF